MALNKDQFKDWADDYRKSSDIRVPQSRFYGIRQLSKDLGIDHSVKDRLGQSEVISAGVEWARNWGEESEVDIGSLRAQHHIDRKNARKVFESIKSEGFDRDEPITVLRGHEDVIVDGHHRTIAAAAAGMRKIPAVIVHSEDVDAGINRYLENRDWDD